MYGHLNLYMTQPFWKFIVPVLGGQEKGVNGVISFAVHLDP